MSFSSLVSTSSVSVSFRRRSAVLIVALLTSVAAACGTGASAAGSNGSNDSASGDSANEAAAMAAKHAYLDGINSNDLATYSATLADDVVYVAPNAPMMRGKAAVTDWVSGYYAAYRTRWEKETVEFVVRGDIAFEHYRYRSVDTPREDGPAAGTPVVADSGNGFNIYRRSDNGSWKLARDAWATETTPMKP